MIYIIYCCFIDMRHILSRILLLIMNIILSIVLFQKIHVPVLRL